MIWGLMYFLIFAQSLFLLIMVMLSVAFFSLFERKVMSEIQLRLGPNKVGTMGILQPISDAMKLLFKMETFPNHSAGVIYYLSPLFFFFACLMMWMVFPSGWIFLNFFKSAFFILVVYSILVYGVILSGWFSNSKYSSIGSIRALAQSISYEMGLTMVIIFVCIMFASSSLEFFWSLDFNLIFPLMFSFFLSVLMLSAEMGRSPFDLPEGESELVSGYSVEYGGLSYTLLFLGENISLLWGSFLLSLFFMKQIFIPLVFFFVWLRASSPRIRFDKMMCLFWITSFPLLIMKFLLYFSWWFNQNQKEVSRC